MSQQIAEHDIYTNLQNCFNGTVHAIDQSQYEGKKVIDGARYLCGYEVADHCEWASNEVTCKRCANKQSK